MALFGLIKKVEYVWLESQRLMRHSHIYTICLYLDNL